MTRFVRQNEPSLKKTASHYFVPTSAAATEACAVTKNAPICPSLAEGANA